MVKARKLTPDSVFDKESLVRLFDENNIKHVHRDSIWTYLLRNPDGSPWDAPDIPQLARDVLKSNFVCCTATVSSVTHSSDERTTKILLELQDGHKIESVIMRYDPSTGKYGGEQRTGAFRATLCVSSQIGCQMACSFCATGTMGMKGQLTAGEIVEQLVQAVKICPIRNIVFMGMGEPLNNYTAVKSAIETFTSKSFGISPSHITVSTVGIIPKIYSLNQDLPGVHLALSLHAPHQQLRSQIVPSARAYPLEKLLKALEEYMEISGKRVLIEYILIAQVNDSVELAHDLGKLFKGKNVLINLIPYNPTGASADYETSSPEDTLNFQKVLREIYGIHTTVRLEMGGDIAGACGQLVVSKGDNSRKQGYLGKVVLVKDIEELC